MVAFWASQTNIPSDLSSSPERPNTSILHLTVLLQRWWLHISLLSGFLIPETYTCNCCEIDPSTKHLKTKTNHMAHDTTITTTSSATKPSRTDFLDTDIVLFDI